jgi:hypothetical protein
MATAAITAEIKDITGVSTADVDFIVSAQKYVVASIPKDLLRWAQTDTVAGTHGGDSSPTAITLPVGTDNIVSVRRDAYTAIESPIEDRAWISNTASLKYATARHPKYYIDAGNKVVVIPVPTDSATAHVSYIDYSKVDDDSDLRSAVTNYACSKEFSKLAISNLPSWDSIEAPIAPSLSSNSVSFSTTAPTFTPPVMQSPDWSDVENWITTEEDSEMLASRIQAINAQISEYQAKVNEAQGIFNKENEEYQAQLKISIQNAQLSDSSDAQSLQNYQSELQEYQLTINKKANDVQNTQFYQKESEKYYSWAQSEIQQYIQNNSKIIGATMAAQKSQRG